MICKTQRCPLLSTWHLRLLLLNNSQSFLLLYLYSDLEFSFSKETDFIFYKHGLVGHLLLIWVHPGRKGSRWYVFFYGPLDWRHWDIWNAAVIQATFQFIAFWLIRHKIIQVNLKGYRLEVGNVTLWDGSWDAPRFEGWFCCYIWDVASSF